jgi:hypothetical protein
MFLKLINSTAIMKFDKKKVFTVSIGVAVGLIGGYAYWHFVGCTSGTCPLTSNWYSSTLVGGLFGYLISDSFKSKKKEEISETQNTPT